MNPVSQPNAGAQGTAVQPAYLAAFVEASKILNSTLDLDHLLDLILEVATLQLRADRGTVWLVDNAAGELRARVAQGLESSVLRLKIGQGFAGTVAETGETIRVEDAAADQRFFPTFDAVFGYRTKSLLATAIRSKTGEIIGVIELLNKIDDTFVAEDEVFLEALTEHIALALQNAKSHEEIVRQQRISTELGLARQTQRNLLRPPPARWHGYRLAASAEACTEVGGDLYDFIPISDTAMSLVIADVSGKGISSALVMCSLQATLRALVVNVRSFERILERLNSTVREFTGGSHYVTLFLALLDSESRRLHYVNAGHNPPLLMRADGSMELLDKGGTVVGLLPDVHYTRAHTEMAPGDLLTLYTDGLVETTNPAGDMFGVEGIVRSVEAVRGGGPELVMSSILSSVREFAAGRAPADDLTLVVISRDSN